jgi:hypothetical protein
MAIVLVVTNPFGGLSHGDRITDPTEIEKVLSGENAHYVVRSDHADVQAPVAAPQPPTKTSKNQE